jgi:hypothetical protein
MEIYGNQWEFIPFLNIFNNIYILLKQPSILQYLDSSVNSQFGRRLILINLKRMACKPDFVMD